MASPSSAFPSPPPDLTKFIVKCADQYAGAGAFGDVYKCRLGPKEVAVKAFRFKLQVDNNAMMARRELGIWRRLDHPNIVPFLGTATGFGMSGSQSLVSLWMPNGTLQSFLEEYENLGIDHRLRLLLDIANGLHYLHSFTLPNSSTPFPIYHGDLSPANVLLDDDYTARLADFGYASMMGEIPEAMTYLRRSTTNLGAVRWVAPEHVVSSATDIYRTTQSDVYSFGCIAIQVLSGKQPWSEIREVVAVVIQLSRGCTPSRPKSQPIDDRHWELIESCLSPIPNRPAANIIVSCIEEFLESCPRSQPLRDVIASLSSQLRSEPPDASYPSSSSSSMVPGEKASDGVTGSNCHDQHVSDSPSQSVSHDLVVPDEEGEGDDESESLMLPGLYRTLHAFQSEGTTKMELEEDQLVRVVGRGGGIGWSVVVKDELKDTDVHAFVSESYLGLVRLDGEDDDA